MMALHMGQLTNDGAHPAQTMWPHVNTTRGLDTTKQMGHSPATIPELSVELLTAAGVLTADGVATEADAELVAAVTAAAGVLECTTSKYHA
jgi:hypothetical protein